jgi:hypothetical protein
MRRILMTAAAVVAFTPLVSLAAPPAAQAAEWPWCADLDGEDGGGGTNCGFASWEQCQTNISGIGGWCYPNPYYRGEYYRGEEQPPRRRDRRQPR